MPHKAPSGGERLEEYRRKRSADRTPEPFGGERTDRPGLFVVQKHAARRLHYDFRLEIGGVLRSWAVPRGPSLDPAEKRLAVATEDHPLEYADFEGVIPADNYGAGAVIVWDQGSTVHHLDPEEGVRNGKLLFELRGHKLRGLWTLVKTSRDEREWLLIKKPDGAATGKKAEELGEGSIFSGLTVEELRDGASAADEIRVRLEALGARRRALQPESVKLMLAQLTPSPFSKPDWIFEIKYDGYRVLAARQPGASEGETPRVTLRYRSGKECTHLFPEIARTLRSLPFSGLVLDGEAVVLDDEARPSFQLLQQRARLRRAADIERATLPLPVILYAFDLLGFEDWDLRTLPLLERKELLRRILPASGSIRFADHVESQGEELYRHVTARGLEGILAKRSDSRYTAGRSRDWQKIRADLTGEFAVIGFTRPKVKGGGFSALHLGVLHGASLTYAGRVGSGFSERHLGDIRSRLEPLRRRTPPLPGPLPSGSQHVWVDPRLVVEVRYTEYTDAGQLRHPVFLRFREDKRVEDCVRLDLPPAPEVEEERTLSAPQVRITRPEKVFWPDEGFTKGDLIGYYRSVAKWLLPYLRDRPVVLDRFPDGIHGKSFFQKNAPEFAPDWVRTEALWSEDTGREVHTFVCDDLETLTYLINSGSIPLHLWSSRLPDLQRPDWCILDLDAKQASFEAAVTVARAVHRLGRQIELPTFLKTSGATGLHVLIPLGRQVTHEQSRQLAELIARFIASELPEVASVARSPGAREGKVYVDYLQNGYGKLLVAPFSVRPLPGAPVSTPLRWRELSPSLDRGRFNTRTVPKRLRRMKRDPMSKVLETAPALAPALDRLSELVSD